MAQGIGIVLEQRFTDRLIELQSEVCSIFGLFPRQNSTTALPHITLLQAPGEVDLGEGDRLERCLKNALPAQCDTSVSLTDIFYKPQGWYFLRVRRDEWLVRCHEAAVREFEPNLLCASKSLKDMNGYSASERDNYARYGYRYIGNEWLPHVTIGRTNDGQVAREATLFDYYSQRLLPAKSAAAVIAVYEIGPNGSYSRSVKELRL